MIRTLPERWMELGILLAMAACAPLVGWSAHRSSRDAGYLELARQARPQLDLVASGMDAELRRYEQIGSLIETSPPVYETLGAERAEVDATRLNAAISRFAEAASARSILLLDAQGRCVAASNWYTAASKVGQSLAESRLFQRAIQQGKAGQFGAVSEAGPARAHYSHAQLIRQAGRVIGVTVVEGGLEQLDSFRLSEASPAGQARLLIVDENGVVVLSSVPELTLRTLATKSIAEREVLRESGRYRENFEMFRPLGAMAPEATVAGQLVGVPYRGEGSPVIRYLMQERPLAQAAGSAVILTDASAVSTNAFRNAAAAMGGVLLAGVLALYLLQYRRESRTRQLAGRLLQKAHDELGVRVEERTAELNQINRELLREIAERERAEAVLRTAQDELVQAGRLALLGQMAAGVAHEVNQPLMAMRALADNAAIFLQRGQVASAQDNLRAISALTERLGGISAQLKGFSRKAPLAMRDVLAGEVVKNAVALLEPRSRAEHVAIEVRLPHLPLRCDPMRLEQVMINLMTNAMDAMKQQPPPKVIAIDGAVDGARSVLRVTDTGHGIADEFGSRLFEPFFTTKPQGEGLGLGLAISASIVNEIGGTLRHVPVARGATFEIELPSGAEQRT